MLTQPVIINVSGADAEEILQKKIALQSITDAADMETLNVMGDFARKPGALEKVKKMADNKLLISLVGKHK